MGMAVPLFYTAEMVRALPDDGKRYETVHGELLVSPAPRPLHQEVISRLQYALTGYLRQHPDVFVVPTKETNFYWAEGAAEGRRIPRTLDEYARFFVTMAEVAKNTPYRQRRVYCEVPFELK